MMEEQPGVILSPRRRRWPWIVLAAALVAVFALAGYVWWGVYRPASSDSSVAEVVVAAGQRSVSVAVALRAAGVIRSPRLFALYAAWTGQGRRLQVGTFNIPRNLTLPQVVSRLTSPARRAELTITALEGWSNRELAEYLAKQGVVSAQDFFRVVQRKAPWWDEYELLLSRPADRDLEGYLFPDTYRVFPGSPVEVLVKKMLDNFGRQLTADLRTEIARQGKTVHAVLTLASIVEREVPDGSDRPQVAGIFLKRLEIGMPLQSDATVNYVTGKKEPRPSADDLRAESLYNTYIHRGLPPGPINNPGISAVRAVLYPQASPYLYYLTAPDGTVVYSRTFEEHVRAKARYYP